MDKIRIGDAEVWSLIERDGPMRSPEAMFPTADPERLPLRLTQIHPFTYDATNNLIVITYQSYVVRTKRHTILIDTCTGDHERGAPLNYPKQPWLDAFNASGLAFEAIDYVFCTHLHVDHVGWNTIRRDGKLVPTFPNARYIFSRRDFEFWSEEIKRAPHPAGPYFEECVIPIVESGKALLVDDDFAIDDELWLTPAPGHSPGQVCVHLRSNGVHAVFTGDMMHHELQCLEPDWSTCFCHDPEMAAETRRRLLAEHADRDVLILPIHFPAPSAGRVVSDGDSFRFKFLGE